MRWTQPANSYMPYRCCPDRRHASHVREDWSTVQAHLQHVVRADDFKAYQWAPGSVEICQAEITGGTPEWELPEVEWRGPKPPPPPPRTRPAAPAPPTPHRPESLPDYESAEEEGEGEGDAAAAELAARRAAVLSRGRRPRPRRRRQRFSSPPTPEPYRRRKRYERKMYILKYRRAGLQ